MTFYHVDLWKESLIKCQHVFNNLQPTINLSLECTQRTSPLPWCHPKTIQGTYKSSIIQGAYWLLLQTYMLPASTQNTSSPNLSSIASLYATTIFVLTHPRDAQLMELNQVFRRLYNQSITTEVLLKHRPEQTEKDRQKLNNRTLMVVSYSS